MGLSFPGPFRGFPPEHIPGKASLFENSEGSPTSSPDHTQSIYINGEDEEGDTLRELERLKLDDSNLDTGVANVKELQVMSRSMLGREGHVTLGTGNLTVSYRDFKVI